VDNPLGNKYITGILKMGKINVSDVVNVSPLAKQFKSWKT